ncbi:MAG: TetR family transcriptional regulator C-terminal domain-containing protein [Acidimicrobiales bacterium]
MPKAVDHDERRGELADAVLRVVAGGGVRAVTLRAVAVEADWSTGALNHYFNGKDDLLVGALKRAMQIIREKVAISQGLPSARLALEQMLVHVLPVDDTRLAFARVWLSFCGEAVAGAEIRQYLADSDDLYRRDLADTVRRGQQAEEFDGSLDPYDVADTLAALVQGMATRTIIQGQGARPDHFEDAVQGWVRAFAPARIAAKESLTL